MSMNHNSLLEKSDSKDKMTLRHFEYSSKDGVASMADIPYYAFPKLENFLCEACVLYARRWCERGHLPVDEFWLFAWR